MWIQKRIDHNCCNYDQFFILLPTFLVNYNQTKKESGGAGFERGENLSGSDKEKNPFYFSNYIIFHVFLFQFAVVHLDVPAIHRRWRRNFISSLVVDFCFFAIFDDMAAWMVLLEKIEKIR